MGNGRRGSCPVSKHAAGQASKANFRLTKRDRLAVHADGVDLGPADAHDWLCGFVYKDPTPAKQRQLRPLAKRIEQLEPAALDLLQPSDTVQDASVREDSDGE